MHLFEWTVEEILKQKIYSQFPVAYRTIEQIIVAAVDDDPLATATRYIGRGGFSGPNVHVDYLRTPGQIVVYDAAFERELLRISIADVVDYVRRKHSPQLTLF